MLNAAQEQELFVRASKGDRQAQDELVERNYWGFIKRPGSLWLNLQRGDKGMNLLSWHLYRK